jgi:prevent-host-death family protein
MHTWQLQEAKSHFSEVVDLTLTEGPQRVTRHGVEAVIIISIADYQKLSGKKTALLDCLLNAPKGQALAVSRSREKNRDVSL